MQITITQPDDWHVHLRDNGVLNGVAKMTAKQFGRAIVMPNLNPPVTTVRQAIEYRERVMSAVGKDFEFEPLMTLYLTDITSADEIIRAKEEGSIKAVKLYPAGATTNSDSGVTDIKNCNAALEEMQRQGMPLLIHGEVTDADVDIFDRERVFIDRILMPLINRFPELKVVFEHITTGEAADFVRDTHSTIAATITPQHLMLNRNAIFSGGIRPHNYCLPVLKREKHRQSLLLAATSGSKKFFLGTDSAPHTRSQKESSCGCAGIFSAHSAIELYAQVFDKENALDRLEAFASINGPEFYGLPTNQGTITLSKESWQIPETIEIGDDTIVPMLAGETIEWKLKEVRYA